MLGRKQEINLQLSQVLDLTLIVVAFWVAYHLRLLFPEFWLFSGEIVPEMNMFYWQAYIIAPLAPLLLEHFGFYDNPHLKRPWPWVSLGQMGKTLIVLVVVIAVFLVLFRKLAESRAVLAVHLAVSAIFLLVKEYAVRTHLRRRSSLDHRKDRVIFAGPMNDVLALEKEMEPAQLAEMAILERVDISTRPIEDLVEAMRNHAAERVVFAAGHVHFDQIQAAVNACEIEGVEAWLWTDFVKTTVARPSFDLLGGKPMLVFRSTPEASWQLLFKNVIDRIGAFFIILGTSPLWLAAYIGIKIQSPGPVIFSQRRSGKNGKPFTMFKFRSMRTDAEQLQAQLTAQNKMSGPVFKVDNDPRIFPFGHFIRRTSIDELPQLINVLLGDMSLVGPRPLPVYEVEKIEEAAQRRRLSVKPGLTCLWQISGRNEITDFKDWVALDLKYIDNWSVWLDIEILLKTVPAVIFRSGAK